MLQHILFFFLKRGCLLKKVIEWTSNEKWIREPCGEGEKDDVKRREKKRREGKIKENGQHILDNLRAGTSHKKTFSQTSDAIFILHFFLKGHLLYPGRIA